MRLSDYIFRTLADWGLRQAFFITGGGAMHLNDALGAEPRISRLCCLHEQACAIAAEAYARVAGIPRRGQRHQRPPAEPTPSPESPEPGLIPSR